MRPALVAVGLAALLSLAAAGPGRVAEPPGRVVERLSAEYLDRMIARRPDLASRLGDHGADARLKAVTQATLDQDAAWLHDLKIRLDAVPRDGLDPETAADRDVLNSRIAADLLSLETERTFHADPNAYLALVEEPVALLLRRDYTHICHRLRAVAHRLAAVPEVLRAARINLERPARLRTETAIERFEAVLRLYRVDVPEAARACRDPRTQAVVAQADSAAVRAMLIFLDFMREDLLPRSDGPLALGEATLGARLAAREMEDAPLDTLLDRARRELDEERARMDVLAERLAPGRGLRAAIEDLERESPRADTLVADVRATFVASHAFASAHRLFEIPKRVHVSVRPSPLGSRFAPPVVIDGPLPWERFPYRIHLDVRPGDGAEAGVDDHRTGPGVVGAEAAAVHEGWTGHLAQSLAWPRTRSRLRQALAARSTVEGWACYGEGLMLDQGFRAKDPAFELVVRQRAAVVLARLIAGISIHARGMDVDEAARFMAERCGLAAADAAREARDLAVDPAAVADQIGVWRMRALRDEVRAALADRFDERVFHAAVLRCGPAPMPVIRRLVLHDLEIEH